MNTSPTSLPGIILLLTVLCMGSSYAYIDEISLREMLIVTEAETNKINARKNTAPKKKEGANKPETKVDNTRVVVLGYHDFSEKKKATEMLIKSDSFRKQMQALKDLKLNVISMEDFIAWKKGEKEIEDKSVVITIDDGWRSVYTYAYPVLKEYGYPFTVFLYTNYVDGGDLALTSKMIKEMQENGCSIGCHSVSHPFPSKVKKEKAKGADSFNKYLKMEMASSREKLKEKFNVDVTSYAYPGGFVTDEMIPVAEEAGYDCLFTVLPGKVTRDLPNGKLPRYIILGTHDYIFRNATTFPATATSKGTDGALIETTAHPVTPAPGEVITDRLPTVSADLSAVENIDASSLIMRIQGFGQVPATYDADKKSFSWKINRRLRSSTCKVSVQWRNSGTTKYSAPMAWTFRVDREAFYKSISKEK